MSHQLFHTPNLPYAIPHLSIPWSCHTSLSIHVSVPTPSLTNPYHHVSPAQPYTACPTCPDHRHAPPAHTYTCAYTMLTCSTIQHKIPEAWEGTVWTFHCPHQWLRKIQVLRHQMPIGSKTPTRIMLRTENKILIRHVEELRGFTIIFNDILWALIKKTWGDVNFLIS